MLGRHCDIFSRHNGGTNIFTDAIAFLLLFAAGK